MMMMTLGIIHHRSSNSRTKRLTLSCHLQFSRKNLSSQRMMMKTIHLCQQRWLLLRKINLLLYTSILCLSKRLLLLNSKQYKRSKQCGKTMKKRNQAHSCLLQNRTFLLLSFSRNLLHKLKPKICSMMTKKMKTIPLNPK